MKLNQKNKLLLLGFILAIYVCYALAVSKTMSHYKKYNSSKEIAQKNTNLLIETSNLKAKEKQLDSFLSENNLIKDELFQNELLKIINQNTVSNKLTIINFNEPHFFVKQSKKIYSYSFTLKGTYSGLTKLMNQIENNKSLGIIIHSKFYKIRNQQNNSEELILDLILQNNLLLHKEKYK